MFIKHDFFKEIKFKYKIYFIYYVLQETLYFERVYILCNCK